MRRTKRGVFFLFAGALCLMRTDARGQIEPEVIPTPYADSIDTRPTVIPNASAAEEDRVAGLREAGLRNERTKISTLIAALQHPARYAVLTMDTEVKTALHALAQMGATEAIPAIDTLIKDTEVKGLLIWHLNPDQIHDIAKAAKARLLAEAKAQDIEDSAKQARAKVDEFYRQLGVTPIEFKQATDQLTGSDTDYQHGVHGRYVGSVTFYALRELADMIYRGNYRDYMSLATVKTLDFSKDMAAALKLKAAQVPKPERAQWLVNDLASRKIMVGDYRLVAQLASDEGKAATAMAADWLRLMNKDRTKYNYNHTARFNILTDFLYYNGAVEQKEVVRLVSLDDKGELSDWEKGKVEAMDSGLRRQYVAGY